LCIVHFGYASEVTTLWRYTYVFITIVIIIIINGCYYF